MSTKKTAAVKPAAAKSAAKPLVAPAAKSAAKVAVKPAKKSPAPAVKKAVASPAASQKDAGKPEKSVKTAKKPKVVRDSFTMPQSEYQKIGQIKALCLKAGLQVKKSEVLRAGVIALCSMSDSQLAKALGSLDKIKTGRPNKH
jgi:hypothetical protein